MFFIGNVKYSLHEFLKTRNDFYQTVKNLKTDYLDLYLLHGSFNTSIEACYVLENLYHEEYVRVIGVYIFSKKNLKRLIQDSSAVPMINQVEQILC